MNESIDALNYFASGRGASNDRVGVAPCSSAPTSAQSLILDDLCACHRVFESTERTSQEALLALLRVGSVYDQGPTTQLAAYKPGLVSLPERQSVICNLSDHLSCDAKGFLGRI